MTAGAGFDVDPVRLRGAAPHFDAIADRLTDAQTALATALRAEGPCWGGDGPGQTFAQGYLPGAESTTRALSVLIETFRGLRVSLDASAGTWDSADQAAAGIFAGHPGAGDHPGAGGHPGAGDHPGVGGQSGVGNQPGAGNQPGIGDRTSGVGQDGDGQGGEGQR